MFCTDDDPVEAAEPKPLAPLMPSLTGAAEEMKQAEVPIPTMIKTTMGPDGMSSTKVGTNNPAFSHLRVEDRHLMIAHQMNKEFAE